jgi:hypothetical protein
LANLLAGYSAPILFACEMAAINTAEGEQMTEDHEHENTNGAGPTRRTIVTGAAWSVPVVALAIATPLAAASTPGEYQLVISDFAAAPVTGGNVSPSQGFNTRGTITNIGTAPVTGLQLQLTFSSQAVADNFSVPSGWVLLEKHETTVNPKRWVVNYTYSGTLEAGASIPFLVSTNTRVASQFPLDSQSFAIIGRIWASDGTPLSDAAQTQITVNK